MTAQFSPPSSEPANGRIFAIEGDFGRIVCSTALKSIPMRPR